MSLRDFQDNKADVLYKYTPDEARALKQQKEIPEGAKINEGLDQNGQPMDEGEDLVQFENDEDIDDVRIVFIDVSFVKSVYNNFYLDLKQIRIFLLFSLNKLS